MDAMALLCTLHADGPTTLRRLRQAGCDSIQTIGSFDADRLAKVLDTTPASARRFLREAAHLAARLDTGFLEREEKGLEAHATEPAAPAAPAATVFGEPTAREKPVTLGYRDQRIVEQVLQAWRKHDAEEGPPARDSAHSPTTRADDTSADVTGAHAAAGQNSIASDLHPGAVDGLDQETCLRLRRAGVHDIEMLSRIDPLALSKTLGVGYMRLTRLCALARRRVEAKLTPGSTSGPSHASPRAPATTAFDAGDDSAAPVSSETKFSRAGNPTIGVMPALAHDLEIHAGPKPLLPSKTHWSPASAVSTEGEDAAGPFA